MTPFVSKKSSSSSQSAGRDSSFKGTILIPDISGFTKFVNETEFSTGREITRQLLEVIISYNILELKISEIEGDAILFYTERTLTPIQIKEQYELMVDRFRAKVNELSDENGFEIKLSLKLIAHFGEISTYIIGDFEKLYGKTVIEAHQLLKNAIESRSYLLITESVFNANKGKFAGTCYYSGNHLCEIYGDLVKVGYVYFDYELDDDSVAIRSLEAHLTGKED